MCDTTQKRRETELSNVDMRGRLQQQIFRLWWLWWRREEICSPEA